MGRGFGGCGNCLKFYSIYLHSPYLRAGDVSEFLRSNQFVTEDRGFISDIDNARERKPLEDLHADKDKIPTTFLESRYAFSKSLD